MPCAGTGSHGSFPRGGFDCRLRRRGSALTDPSPGEVLIAALLPPRRPECFAQPAKGGRWQLLRKACLHVRHQARHPASTGGRHTDAALGTPNLPSGCVAAEDPDDRLYEIRGRLCPYALRWVSRESSDLSGLIASSVSVGAAVLVLAAPVAVAGGWVWWPHWGDAATKYCPFEFGRQWVRVILGWRRCRGHWLKAMAPPWWGAFLLPPTLSTSRCDL